MLENEDSVVTSLNELRKLKHERITRQTQTRAVVGAGRAAALAVDPAADQMTPPPQAVPSMGSVRPAPFGQLSGQGGFSGFDVAAPVGFVAPVPAPPVIQVKTSYKAAVIMTVLLLGVGGAGYVMLHNDMQAQLAEKDAKIKRAEDDRALAAGVAERADVQARNNLRQCEDKLKTALAAAVPAAPAVVEPSVPAVEKKPAKPTRIVSRAARSRSRPARASRRASADTAPKSANVPTIARKKKLDNDPLSGLGKL
jgi:hypothetical protein